LTAALDATTDSKGQITLVVKNATAVTAGTLALAIAGQNITNTVTITYAAPTYTVTDLADSATSNGRTIVKASAYKLDYKVVDQFGDAPSKSSTAAFRLVDTVTGTTATANGGTYYSAIAADGTASFSFTDNSTVAGSGAHVITIQSSTDGFANQTAVAGTVTTTVVIKATALEATAKTITLGNPVPGAGQAATTFAANVQTGKANLSEADFVASFDARYAKTAAPTLGKGYTAVPTHSSGSWTAGTAGTAGAAKITIPVTVKDSTVSATALDGATVTVTGKGLFFKAGNAYGSDSLTFLADSGSTSVDVYSHVTGEQSIVFTSGTATSTQKITFTNFGTEVASVTLGTLAAQAQAGQSLSLSATAKDKWGNLVDNVAVVFSNTGAGYIQDISAQLTVAGVANGRLIALGADLGTSTVTATAAKAKTLLTADLTSAKSIELGVTDADVTVGGRAVYASVEFAKGKTVTVTVDGRRLYSKLFSTDAYTELKFTQKKAGKHTVTIRVSGGIVYSETVVTTK
jgi:hypothetical protein